MNATIRMAHIGVGTILASIILVPGSRLADVIAPPTVRAEVIDGGKVLALSGKVLDIIPHVQDLGGQVIGLAVKETAIEVKFELAGDVLFDFDKWDIRKEAEPVLQQVADGIRKYPKGKLKIDGYTDAKGDDDYNLRLSQKRAASVSDWLKRSGNLPSLTVTTRGLGENNPVASNTKPDGSDDPDGRQKNRRVELTLKKG